MTAPIVKARTPDDLLAAVPVVMGFHPRDSVVLMTFTGKRAGFQARVDLPDDEPSRSGVAEMLRSAANRNGSRRAVLIAYTDDHDLAVAAIDAVADALAEDGLEILLEMRADGREWFDLSRDDPVPQGTAYDLGSHPLTADAIYRGLVVEASREDLVAGLEPYPDRDQIEAVGRAVDLVTGALYNALRSDPPGLVQWCREQATWVRERVRRYLDDGERLPSADAGRLLLCLGSVHLRDVAWAEMTRECAQAHVDLWRDLLRRCPEGLEAPPASLLAFAAWLAGDGALAWCAVDRAETSHPGYTMAGLVAHALANALPPTEWTPIPAESLPVWDAPDLPAA